MKEIPKFQCEYCHVIYDKKEIAIECEEKHKALKDMPIKCILYEEDSYPLIRVETFPNAKYKESADAIQLQPSSFYGNDFILKYRFYFDEIQQVEDENTIKFYTTNFDENYEKECIQKIINYKIDDFNNRIKILKEISASSILRNEYK